MNLDKLVKFIFSNFGPLIGFYFINQFWGFKAATVISCGIVVMEYAYLKFRREPISSFFYFSSAIIIIFGVADLSFKEPFFFKFEAFLTNLFFAVFFGMSIFKQKSIIQEFAESQKRTSLEQSQDKQFFFKLLTSFWTVYFILKGGFYLWINFSTSLNETLLIRMVVGKMSFWVMMILTVGLSKQIWKWVERFEMFPSQRLNQLQPPPPPQTQLDFFDEQSL